MKVPVERKLEQVKDGTDYKGMIKIGAAQFDFELKFSIPIPQLDAMPAPTGMEDIRRIFGLVLKKDGVEIPLTDHEWKPFFHLLVEFAVEFCHNPQIRDNNEGMAAREMSNSFPIASISMDMAGTTTFDFKPELCSLLNAPKFGCALAA